MDYRVLYQVNEAEQKQKYRKGMGVGFLIGFFSFLLMMAATFLIFCVGMHGNIMIGRSGVSLMRDSQIFDVKTMGKLEQLAAYVDAYYYQDYDQQQVRDSMYAGLIQGLGDKYSAYYTEEEYQRIKENNSGTYFGIGMGMVQDLETMQITVSKVYPGTPSEQAGLQEGDQILSVDGTSALDMELSELVSLIRGQEGSTVHLEVYREKTQETLKFDVERQNVQLPSVSSELLEGGVGYLAIDEFNENTSQQFQEQLQGLEDQGMKGLIIDLRGNPGGLLNSVVSILDTVLPEGKIVYTEDKYGKQDVYNSDAACFGKPLVVLVDENSASASEIFAGAIKDYHYGTLIGTTTFGKGIVQSLYELPDGDALRITTSSYFTPDGNNIHNVGITPDIVLEFQYTGPENEPYDMKYDNQIQKAIEVLSHELES